MSTILTRDFYEYNTLKVARDLLDKFLVRKIGKKIIAGMITETEAYCGPNDLASHASRGRTPRTEIMFGPPGRAYIYIIYGMYYCLNIVTEKKGYPAAVLIRGVKIDGVDYSKTNGPGKLCKFLKIDKKLNGIDITKRIMNTSSPLKLNYLKYFTPQNMAIAIKKGVKNPRQDNNLLWIEDHGVKIKPSQIQKTSRIGVDYAGKYKDKKWRFIVKLPN